MMARWEMGLRPLLPLKEPAINNRALALKPMRTLKTNSYMIKMLVSEAGIILVNSEDKF